MPAPAFIGDEISALAYRLAGAQVRTPPPEQTIAALHWARKHAPLVLLSAEYARHVPSAELERLLAAVSPPLVIVPDLRGRMTVDDLTKGLRRQLGVSE